VKGLDERRNDVLYHPPCREEEPPQGALLFFGGDVQDLEEEQAKHRDNRHVVFLTYLILYQN
jgi:hypothetical protein